MIVTPVPIPAAGQPIPDPTDMSTWAVRMGEMHRWERVDAIPGVNTQSEAAYQNALDAKASAEAAVAVAGATMWSAATNYATGAAVKSPTTYKVYIRKSPGGVDATDPASSALWEPQHLTRVTSGALEFWDTATSQWVPAGWKTLVEGVSLTGTAYDLTGLPTWVREIDIEYSGVSGTANDFFGVLLGSSAGFVSTGYETSAWGSGGSNTIGTSRHTTGFYVANGALSTWVMQGRLEIRRLSGNLWRAKGSGQVEGSATNYGNDGKVTLPGQLDRLRLLFATGSFDGTGVASIFARA